MFRASLCLAAAAVALWLAPADALAHGCGHGHSHHHEVYVHSSFVGFLDYRHSLDRNDDPGYRAYRHRLDDDLEYAFHGMTAQEAGARSHGGGDWDGDAHRVVRTVRYGGGPHNEAWGVHKLRSFRLRLVRPDLRE